QALRCDQVKSAKISVSGLGMNTPLLPSHADDNGFLAVSGCQIAAQIDDVPYGLRIVTVELYDSADQLITGSTLKRVFLLDPQAQTVMVSSLYLPTAQVLETLLAGTVEQQFFAQN